MDGSFERVMDNFMTIASIPRSSGDEKEISDYLAGFGQKLGLHTEQDNALNVIIKKPGSPGYEKSSPVILQGHMDMVFVSDEGAPGARGVKVIGDEGWIKAEGTSLGADNGIALAYIMTILQSDNIPHPPIEALFTASEETSMHGAVSLDPARLAGRILINFDSEEEGKLIAGCAGGVIATVRIPVKMKPVEPGDTPLAVKIHGLKGGHSGLEIDKQRGNAIKLLGRILKGLTQNISYRLVSIDGGAKSNAIPPYASAVITINSGCSDNLDKALRRHWQDDLKKEYSVSDPDLTISCEPCSHSPAFRMSRKTRDRVLRGIMMMPDGVYKMSLEVPGLVHSSCNLGVISTTERDVVVTSLIRSATGNTKNNLAEVISCVAESIKGNVKFSDDYPEWEFAKHSPIRDVCVKVYNDMFGKNPEVSIIHAGLECGILSRILPGVDMISYGPDIIGAHTTEEKMSVSSAYRVWKYTLAVLKYLK
jgi:dipeptidase D